MTAPGFTDPCDVLAALVLEDGRRWIDAADDVQVRDAQAWAHADEPYHFATRARGYSKTADAAGLALGVLLTATDRRRLFWLAADAEQGRLALESIEGYLSRTEGLESLVQVQAMRVIAAESGSSLAVLPADAAGSWGLRPDWVFVDELAQWAETPSVTRLWEAVTTAMTKRPGSRMLVITTAGSPSHHAAGVLKAAQASALWRVSETRGPAPWADPLRLEEQRSRPPASIYAQLYGNEWTEITGDFLDPDAVDAAFTLLGPSPRVDGRSYLATLDLGSVHDRTVLAVGHREGQETHLDLLRVWQGRKGAPVQFDVVGEDVFDTCQQFGASLIVDPWQAKELVTRLGKRGLTVREFHFSAQSKMRLASTLLHALNSHAVRLYPADGLREELIALRVKQQGGGLFTFDHVTGGHDDMAVTVAMLLVGLLERGDGRVQSLNGAPSPWSVPSVKRGGLLLTGSRYLDVEPGGGLVAPPGWGEVRRS